MSKASLLLISVSIFTLLMQFSSIVSAETVSQGTPEVEKAKQIKKSLDSTNVSELDRSLKESPCLRPQDKALVPSSKKSSTVRSYKGVRTSPLAPGAMYFEATGVCFNCSLFDRAVLIPKVEIQPILTKLQVSTDIKAFEYFVREGRCRSQAYYEYGKKSFTGDEDRLAYLEENCQSYNGIKPICGITKAELRAIHEYTSSGYKSINGKLRQGERSAVAPLVDAIESGLSKLRPHEGVVRRGANLPAEALADHKVGHVVQYKAFTSTSIGSGFMTQHRFIIKTSTGRYVDSISTHSGEREVLISPGARFKILDREEMNGGITFIMEEIAD